MAILATVTVPADSLATPPSADQTPGDPALAVPSTPPPSTSVAPQRPDWLKPQYKTVEDQARAFVELERRLGSTAPATPALAGAPTDAGAIPTPSAPSAPFDWQAAAAPFAETWARDKRLSEDQYQTLERQYGQPRALVDQFFGGQAAQIELRTRDARDRVGGKAALDAMLSWAGANLSPQEIAQYEAARRGTDNAHYFLLVDAISGRWRNATGGVPMNSYIGSGYPSAGAKPYATYGDYVADIKKPEYSRDATFRAECDARAAVSPWLQGFAKFDAERQ